MLQLEAGCLALGSGQAEPGLQLDPHYYPKALSGQGPAKEPRTKGLHVHSGTHPAVGKLLHVEEDNVGRSHLATLTLRHSECQEHQAPKTPFHQLPEVLNL